MRNKVYSKRNNNIYLNSRKINNIFFALKKGSNYENIKDNYIFEITEDKSLLKVSEDVLLDLKIIIPKHQKYLRFITEYEDFKSLYKFMHNNANDNLIIPFHEE